MPNLITYARKAANFTCTVGLLFASVQSSAIEFENYQLEGNPENATVMEYRGRPALQITGGRYWFSDMTLSDGVIEFDAAMDESHTFFGLIMRAESDNHFENIYLRAHLNKKPDAMQYMPVVNGISSWQIFSDQNAISAAKYDYNDWNKVKIVVQGDKADIYVNSNEPTLHVPDLKTDIKTGRLGLWMFSIEKTPVYFSNLQVRALTPDDKIVGTAKETPALADGLIRSFKVSEPVPEDTVGHNHWLDLDIDKLSWQSLEVESNGIANLAKLSGIADKANTVLIHESIETDKAEMRKLRFGYSDRVQIFLNGKLVFAGNAGWKQRDYRFLGTIGLNDAVGLSLQEGKNDLVIAVSETFGGWGWTAAWE
ncbi:hypothetical protein [Planctobacterium marinum]|uniref:3-keto-disaccharide hydrolase domain-containing protein n=1 Tax=Planctobacterium marinum TaxID=1631968 RepID=A0AA48HML9_9ALTE|nr:hypothetical protein MACH26_35400 [Planctobacterium marinum]